VKKRSVYKEEDTVVPRFLLPELLEGVHAITDRHAISVICYGHAGDGNIHVNLLQEGLDDAVWERELPGVIREINAGIEKAYDVDLSLSMSQIPLPPHHESDRSLALSMLMRYGMTDARGNPVSWEASITITLVHLRAKILYLGVLGEKADLEWTRSAAHAWAEAVVAANPSTGAIAEQEQGDRFDWVAVMKYGIIGALVAGLVSAFAAAAMRRKSRGG